MKKRRTLSIILSALMAASVLTTASVSAATADGSETGRDLYELPLIYNTNDISECTSTMRLNVGSYIYDGKAKKPNATICVGSTNLIKGTDYTITYKNNVNIGTATAVITGMGKYYGSKSLNFIIAKESKSFTECSVTLPDDTFEYYGCYYEPRVIVEDSTKTLVKNCDYTVSCKNSVNAGTATITVTGRGMYKGKVEKNFKITKRWIFNESIHFIYDTTQNGYHGQDIIVMDGNKMLRGGEDYGISIRYIKGFPGEALITITGLGNYYGTRRLYFFYDSPYAYLLDFDEGTPEEPIQNDTSDLIIL